MLTLLFFINCINGDESNKQEQYRKYYIENRNNVRITRNKCNKAKSDLLAEKGQKYQHALDELKNCSINCDELKQNVENELNILKNTPEYAEYSSLLGDEAYYETLRDALVEIVNLDLYTISQKQRNELLQKTINTHTQPDYIFEYENTIYLDSSKDYTEDLNRARKELHRIIKEIEPVITDEDQEDDNFTEYKDPEDIERELIEDIVSTYNRRRQLKKEAQNLRNTLEQLIADETRQTNLTKKKEEWKNAREAMQAKEEWKEYTDAYSLYNYSDNYKDKLLQIRLTYAEQKLKTTEEFKDNILKYYDYLRERFKEDTLKTMREKLDDPTYSFPVSPGECLFVSFAKEVLREEWLKHNHYSCNPYFGIRQYYPKYYPIEVFPTCTEANKAAARDLYTIIQEIEQKYHEVN